MKKLVTGVISALLIITSVLPASGKTDTIHYETSPFQFTFFVPPFSSNGLDNANYVNDVSLNLFIGVSGGVDGMELGGFINVDRFFVRGSQGAGFGNSVGGFLDGFQAAGFFNAVGGDARYVQGAGFINITGGNQFGLQGAGFANVVGNDLTGFQGAGFANVVGGNMNGFQGAGFMNVTGDSTSGFQASGFMNVARKYQEGAQAAGFGNLAETGKVNLQASGFFNVADEIEGAQVAGFINKAGYVKGFQAAGFINLADSIDGIPVAPFSIVRYNGYQRLEIAASETQFQASFRLGVEKFYTIYGIGKTFVPASRWMYGAGAGTQLPLGERSFMNIEAMVHHEFWMGDERTPRFIHHSRMNMVNQLAFTYGMRLGNFAEWFVGPTLNLSIAHTESTEDGYIPWEPIAPEWTFADQTYQTGGHQTNYAFWLGFRGGLRF
ncbi:MAG: hypothetical protein K9G38_05785 [Bacteroidales bacterium]|nr:hypothetical protein [Bacteroidales bacterium]